MFLFYSALIILAIGCTKKLKNQNEFQQNGNLTDTTSTSNSDSLTYVYKTIVGLEIPLTLNAGEVVTHGGFTLEYNEEHEQADWVAYLLTSEKAKRGV